MLARLDLAFADALVNLGDCGAVALQKSVSESNTGNASAQKQPPGLWPGGDIKRAVRAAYASRTSAGSSEPQQGKPGSTSDRRIAIRQHFATASIHNSETLLQNSRSSRSHLNLPNVQGRLGARYCFSCS